MNKNVKKLLGLLLSIVMLCSLLPMNVMAAESDGYYFKLEESDATTKVGFSQAKEYDFYSGGKALVLGTQTAPDEDGYYLEFEVEITKAGNYTIWSYGGQSGSDWASPTKVVIDDTTVLEPGNTTGSEFANSYGVNHQVAFQSVSANLTADTHTIKYMVDSTAPSNSAWYLGAFDFMMIVPANYTWTPSKTDLPVAPVKEYIDFHADGYAWLEETDYSDKNGFSTARSGDIYSGSAAAGLGTTAVPEGDGYYFDYYLNVPATGSYDIWIHGTDTSVTWASPVKVQLGGETVTMERVGTSTVTWDGNWSYGWNKATVNLEAGKLDLRYLVDEKRSGDNTYYFAVLDMICIVPTSYGWTQSITDKPVKPLPKFEITDFAIAGTVEAGQTVTAAANVKRNDGESGNINLILAVYDSDNQLVAIDICELPVGDTAVDFDCSIAIRANVEGTLHAKAFLWTDFSELEPITSGISTLD